MVTTLVEMYLTLGNQIYILVAAQGDSTLLVPNSFKEQDVVRLCIGLGQEHPEGVLKLSDTVTVLAFQCNTNIMAVMCYLTAAKVW